MDKKSKNYEESLEKLEKLKVKAEEKIFSKFTELKDLVVAAKETKKRLDELKMEFINEVNRTNKEISTDMEKSNNLNNKFRSLYKKFSDINALFKEIDIDVGSMEDELTHILKKEAIVSNRPDISDQLKSTDELKQMYDDVKIKKKELEEYLERVNGLVEELVKE
jgi:hypothetical protein